MTEVITTTQLKELQKAIRDQFITLYKNNTDALRAISSRTKIQDSTPCAELVKLSQLIKSHTTKIGIILNPETFTEENYNATYKELKSFIDYVFFYFSLLPLFYKDEEYPEYMLKKIDNATLELLNGMEVLCDELDKKFEQNDTDEDRLLCVGMIWSSCDTLEDIGKKGKFGLLADSIRESSGLVDDVLSEVDEFLEEPTLGNGFMLDDGFDSDEDEEEETPKIIEDDKETLEKLSKFLETWKTKLKMIKLLLSSFTSTISSSNYKSTNKKGSILDDLYSQHQNITQNIDELIGDVFMTESTFESSDFEEQIELLNKSLTSIISVMKRLNDEDVKKSKWINVWEAKYFEN
ncbi:similar to Saccharomyces cerevisiae YLR287C Putative protein of unknown function [Maudiozyma saulgeensis]|uniref:Uncharacterized protein n=1 Tax=Maudiozyma saulgeensis TaxID=1789683 RepID=A0A1X7R7P1_9SACH|nr:similar to Saccharomyces cerevisiae YLR287C Putative protein of unknown function [Kazachstania saulgeensis]